MGNCITCAKAQKETKSSPIEQIFSFPSQLPSWPQGGGFAGGKIDLGGLEVCQVSTFRKIWAIAEGGPDNLGATFFEPSAVPDGFSMLGCYAQPNNRALFGWVLVGKAVENVNALKAPVDYTLVWSSESLKYKTDSNGYIWLPTPPDGYKAAGLVVTNSPGKPALDKVRCVQTDLVESCAQDAWIWGTSTYSDKSEISIYSLIPTVRGTQALGVAVGTFSMQMTGTGTGTETKTVTSSLSCLKNRNANLSCMPNLSQIDALVQTYSPSVYLHPDEPYLPSSVNWYFDSGALLYKKGDESNPVTIQPNGTNLPQGGSNDGEYWLDLPVNENSRNEVKKGDLQSAVAYLHIKPMLGATFTDVTTWVFYPFNGPAKAKVQLIDIPLGRIGEHVGDWEHVTLRISNFTGELWRAYFSEHSGGTWVNASELEFQKGNKVVAYASLHGHAFYSKPGLFLQGNAALGIGLRNDTGKSDTVMDISRSYEVISADYLGTVVEPPWLNYDREWGPKISYDIADELRKIKNLLPAELKTLFEKFISAIPNEVFGEEGPTGPKMKNNWGGDES